jgi:outer membrane protein assembly factor BamE (lipoprotein component of BamABCDE complex)
MRSKRSAVIAIVVVVVLPLGYLLLPETYCFFYPSIDTRYTEGFTESKFAAIRVGMTQEEVVKLLGEPFDGASARASSRWAYTQDGKCTWKDWAWLGREIVFAKGRVVEIVARVYYD